MKMDIAGNAHDTNAERRGLIETACIAAFEGQIGAMAYSTPRSPR